MQFGAENLMGTLNNVCILYFGRITMLHGERCRILSQWLLRQYRNIIIVYLTAPQKEGFSSTFKCLNSNPEASRRQS